MMLMSWLRKLICLVLIVAATMLYVFIVMVILIAFHVRQFIETVNRKTKRGN